MARLSLQVVMAALATLVAAQEGSPSKLPSALPAVSSPEGMACGGCYVVADVAGVVFGGVTTATQTHLVSVGNNGSVVTTSVIENQGKATFTNGAPVPGAPTSFNPLSSVITVNGATLTSPTSYEVFTAFSVITTVSGESGCEVSTLTPSTLPVASKYAVPANANADFLLSVESQFIQAIGFPECSAGGGTVQSTVHSMITTQTTTHTTTGLIRPTPVAASTVAQSTLAPTFNFPNVTQPSISPAIPSVTITPAVNEAPRPMISLPMAVVLAVGAALVRWL